jgi:IS5 family transposase
MSDTVFSIRLVSTKPGQAHPGYSVSQVIRKRVEEIFGWTKTVANFRKTRFRGLERTQLASYLVGAAYNLMRMSRLLTPTPA